MGNNIAIEDIEGMRRHAGIEDAELRAQIRGLRVGDCVRLTFLFGPGAGQTLPVRVTSIHGDVLRGKLVCATAGLARLRAGLLVSFRADQIHSIPKHPGSRQGGRSQDSCPIR